MSDIHKLKILAARLNRIADDINHGGCCVVASLIAPYISMYYPTVIRVLDDLDTNNNLNEVRTKLKSKSKESWNSKGIYFGHVMLEIKVGDDLYYFDTDNLLKNSPPQSLGSMPLSMYEGFITYEEARVLASRSKGWNNRFDRSKIKSMKMCVEHFFLNSMRQPLQKLQRDERKLASKMLDLSSN